MFAIICLLACDTEGNVEPRYDDYFVKYFGQDGNQSGSYFSQVSDGGFLIVGTSIGIDDKSDIYLVKTDSLGNELWSATYGDPDLNEEGITFAMIPGSTGYILAGNVISINGDTDILLVKTDMDGQEIGSATIGAVGFDEQVSDLLITAAGNIMAAGSTTNLSSKPTSSDADTHDFYFPLFDMSFNPVPNWTGKYGFDSDDRIQSVDQKPDGKFIFLGTSDREETNSSDKAQSNMIAFQISINGLPDSEDQTFGTLGNETASAMSPTSDGGYVMVGSTVGTEGISNAYISRINATNAKIGSYKVNNTQDVQGKSVYEVKGGGYVVLGTVSDNTNDNIIIARTDAEGSTIWERTFGGDSDDTPGRVVQLSDKSLIFVGTATLDNQTKIVLIKTNEDGDLSP